MNELKLGVMYASSNEYAMPTCVSLCSVLDNNEKAEDKDKVEIECYVYAENWSEESLSNITKIANQYGCSLNILNPENIYGIMQKIDKEPWAGSHNGISSSYAPDIRLFAADEIEIEYNLLCLDSDVIMLPGTNLRELTEFDFKKINCVCASTIDPQSSPFMKQIPKLDLNENIYNMCGIFLVNPKMYKEKKISEKLIIEMSKVSYPFRPYWNVLRNSYALRDYITPLSMKYQIFPPMKGLISIKDWIWMYNININEFYSYQEIQESIENPVFVHFVNWIIRKPWYSYEELKINLPFHDTWTYFQNMTPYKIVKKEKALLSESEKFRVFVFKNFYKLYIVLCGFFYRKEVRKRNKIVKARLKQLGIHL